MEQFDLPKEALFLTASFLSNRLQRVIKNGHTSTWRRVTSGVVQGSVLGPLLFVLFINDLSPCLANSRMIAYADDITIVHNVNPEENDNLQKEADALHLWSQHKRLSINYNKTKSMTVFRNKLDRPPLNIVIDDTVIEEKDSLSILGIIFDNNCSWESQGKALVSKTTRAIGLVRKVYMT